MPVILLDIDGCVAGFIEGICDLFPAYTPNDFRTWKLEDTLNPIEIERLHAAIEGRPGFCFDLRPLPYAREFVKRLQAIGEVYAATSPWLASPYWLDERAAWCETHLGIPAGNVIQTPHKHLIHGDYMIEDSVPNLLKWEAYDPGSYDFYRKTILLKRPWNQPDRHLIDARFCFYDSVINHIKTREGISEQAA